jgi:hypothetical protein
MSSFLHALSAKCRSLQDIQISVCALRRNSREQSICKYVSPGGKPGPNNQVARTTSASTFPDFAGFPLSTRLPAFRISNWDYMPEKARTARAEMRRQGLV